MSRSVPRTRHKRGWRVPSTQCIMSAHTQPLGGGSARHVGLMYGHMTPAVCLHSCLVPPAVLGPIVHREHWKDEISLEELMRIPERK